MAALDKQVGGTHYSKLLIQPVEYIFVNKIPFIEGCIIKYATRWRDKGGVDDLNKIIHFVELLKELHREYETGDDVHSSDSCEAADGTSCGENEQSVFEWDT